MFLIEQMFKYTVCVNNNPLAIVRKPFELLDSATADEVDHPDVYSGLRTRDEGLYTRTNAQPGTSRAAEATRSTVWIRGRAPRAARRR